MKFYLIPILAIIYCYPIAGQITEERIVARAGSYSITESEFEERFEFTPQFRKHVEKNRSALKLDFLYTLIAEKLWAQYAMDNSLDTITAMQTASRSIEKMFVRDALYKIEITDKIKISDEELQKAYQRAAIILKIKFLFSENETEIRNLYSLLKSDFPFNDILSARPEFSEQSSPIEVIYGMMEKGIEDSLYILKPGEFTEPLPTPDGWYIFYVEDIVNELLNGSKQSTDVFASAKKILKKRKETERYWDFYYNFFNKVKVSTDRILFQSLVSKIHGILNHKKTEYGKSNEDVIHIEPADLIQIENEFTSDSLNMPFVRFEKNPVTLKDFLRQIMFDGIYLQKTDPQSVMNYLNNRVRKFIEGELLSREGYRRGLNMLPEVRRETEMWRTNYLMNAARSFENEKVIIPDSLARRYYNKIYKEEHYPLQVNIVEALVKDIDTLQVVVDKLRSGVDISELARRYSQREETKKSGGEFGFFPTTSFGEIGRIAGQMEVGEIYGPIKIPEGYSIFKLIDKREEQTLPPSKTFEEAKDEIKRRIKDQKLLEQRIKSTADLASRCNVEINTSVLNSIEVTNINSFAVRHMGFGGKITAAPLVAPFSQWVEYWLKNKRDIP